MKGRKKIFNDPVYGFVELPRGLLLDIVDHPWFQRLRHIRQTGMAQLVYPGALHTRFHHVLGACHLMQQAIEVLRSKDVEITEAEAEGACAAILLHDIGHGPYSHALENTIVDLHHEELSLQFMQALNVEFDGALNTAIAIFTDIYPKRFLHQLISGQLDMDRMDYLNRDSFYTGVSEGVIGYDRIIKMLTVHNGQLMVEEKGIYSIEKFLIARRLMYWQVYLHKTSVSAENMLIKLLSRAKELVLDGEKVFATPTLQWFFERLDTSNNDAAETLAVFAHLDDSDLNVSIKEWKKHSDPLLSLLADGLHNRKLFRLEWIAEVDRENRLRQLMENARAVFPKINPKSLIIKGSVANQSYNPEKEQIHILFKNGTTKAIEHCSDALLFSKKVEKKFLCYPKEIS